MRLRICALLPLLLLLAAANTPALNTPPPILKDVGLDQKIGSQVPPNVVFNDESGNPVKLGDYFGHRPIILNLVYFRCPMLCTMVVDDLIKSMNQMPINCGQQFDVLTISFDPHETPALAAAKKQACLAVYTRPQASQGWHFLTGSQESIQQLTQAVGFRYAWDAASGQYAHPSGIIILSPDGKVSRYFFGIDYAPNDLRLSLADAAAGTSSAPVSDQVLLFCFHYDPSTGRYGLLIWRLVQLGGFLTLATLGGTVALLFRRSSKKMSSMQ